MSDWNTLHYFDNNIFYDTVVPDFKDKGILLKSYFNSRLGKFILRDTSRSEERINNILAFCKLLDPDFRSHKMLLDIVARKKKETEKYDDFISKYYQDQEEFSQANADTIEDFNSIFALIVFSECAVFSPYLILGRKIFTGSVIAKSNSLSEDILSNFTNRQSGSVYSIHGSGLINWINCEELKLLLLDRGNLFPASDNTTNYFNEFIRFIEIAVDNNWGVVSGTNMNESVLKMIEKPKISIDLDGKKMGFVNIINDH